MSRMLQTRSRVSYPWSDVYKRQALILITEATINEIPKDPDPAALAAMAGAGGGMGGMM